MTPLSPDYFARPTLDVARDLIGARLVREHPSGETLVGRIVETEGYTEDDPAFHGWGVFDLETRKLKREGRGIELFGEPGTAYVYLIYGRYWLLNVVTEPEDVGGAVLLRAVEPLAGKLLMHELRPNAKKDVDLTNGPGKLTQAFDIGEDFHTTMLDGPPLYFAAPEDGAPGYEIATSSRIGLTKGIEHPWRFFARGHPYVSPGTPSDQR